MRMLSFDTSANALHVCTAEAGEILWRSDVAQGPQRQEITSLLMPNVDRAFFDCGWSKQSLDLIVVGVGPGSFTGIRVAVITARTLGQALGLPVVGVPLLETIAYANGTDQTPAAVVLATTSNHFFFAAYASSVDDPVSPRVPATYGDASDLVSQLRSIPLWLTDAKPEALVAPPGVSIRLLPEIRNIAEAQAKLVHDRLSLKRLKDQGASPKLIELYPWHDVLPLYLRSPSVTVKKSNAITNS